MTEGSAETEVAPEVDVMPVCVARHFAGAVSRCGLHSASMELHIVYLEASARFQTHQFLFACLLSSYREP
eukprot:6209243-Pleurochrysis_carterae.AAC.4